jgi:hypothetical protein
LRRERDFGLVLRPVRRESRARRSLKWICTGASVFFLLLWLGSLRWMAGYRGDIWELGYFDGRVSASAHYAGASEDLPRWYITVAPMQELGLLWPRFGGESGAGILLVPLWVPLVVFFLPSVPLWWLDRRRWVVSSSTCEHCGYSLIGLREPRCPECGQPFSIRPSMATAAPEPKPPSESRDARGKMDE